VDRLHVAGKFPNSEVTEDPIKAGDTVDEEAIVTSSDAAKSRLERKWVLTLKPHLKPLKADSF
jgi:hypothetical protein